MVYMHFPQHLTDEEVLLQKKYQQLRKKKKALALLTAPKPEPQPEEAVPKKRPASEAAEAKEHAKKLIRSGAIKLETQKKEQGFKRSKRLKDSEKTPTTVSFQPFSPSHSGETEYESGGRPRVKKLYDSFISSTESRYDRDDHDRDRDRDRDRRDREPPKKGNTIYVNGHGVSEDILRKAFNNIGSIVNVSMETDKNCGFVTFEKMESADQAISEMNGSMVAGVQLKVSMARRQPNFEQAQDPSSTSWASIAASHSQKGSHKDKRDLVTYDDEDIF